MKLTDKQIKDFVYTFKLPISVLGKNILITHVAIDTDLRLFPFDDVVPTIRWDIDDAVCKPVLQHLFGFFHIGTMTAI